MGTHRGSTTAATSRIDVGVGWPISPRAPHIGIAETYGRASLFISRLGSKKTRCRESLRMCSIPTASPLTSVAASTGGDSIHNASERFITDKPVVVLYFGDFDPSGEDMVRSLRDRLSGTGLGAGNH